MLDSLLISKFYELTVVKRLQQFQPLENRPRLSWISFWNGDASWTVIQHVLVHPDSTDALVEQLDALVFGDLAVHVPARVEVAEGRPVHYRRRLFKERHAEAFFSETDGSSGAADAAADDADVFLVARNLVKI